MAVELVGQATPYSTGTTTLTGPHTITVSGDLLEGDLVIIFVARWFASTNDNGQIDGDYFQVDVHYDTPSWWNDSLVYTEFDGHIIQPGEDGPSFDFTIDGSGANFRGAVFGAAFRNAEIHTLHGPSYYVPAIPSVDGSIQYGPDTSTWVGAFTGTQVLGVRDHDDGIDNGSMLVFHTLGAVGGVATSAMDATVPTGVTQLDELFGTFSASGAARTQYFNWGYEVIASPGSEGQRYWTFTYTGGSPQAATDRYLFDVTAESIPSDFLSTVATIDHDLLIGVEEDQHHAKIHPLTDEEQHYGGYIYKSGDRVVSVTDADVLAAGILAAADGQVAVSYDTLTGQTFVWTRLNGTWAGVEVNT